MTLRKFVKKTRDNILNKFYTPYKAKKKINLTAHTFYFFWSHIQSNQEPWQVCDILITCPVTHSTATQLFPNKKILLITDADKLYNLFLDYQSNRLKCLGIISPELSILVNNNQFLLTRIMQICSNTLTLVLPSPDITALREYLLTLHACGFYEILTSSKDVNIISQSYLASGEYSYFSTSPVFYNINNNIWLTHIAHRMASIDNNLPWHTDYGRIVLDDQNRLKSLPGIFSLATTIATSFTTSLKIEAEFSWTSDSKTVGHASLITSYNGPNDTNMYALLVKLDDELNPIIYLYKSTKTWSLICHKIPEKNEIRYSEQGANTMNLWLETTQSHVRAGSGTTILIDVVDTDLPRNSCWGIRMIDDDIGLNNLKAISC